MPASTVLFGVTSRATSSSPSAACAVPQAASAAATAAHSRCLTTECALIGHFPWVVRAVDVGMAVQAGAGLRDADAARIGPGRAAGDAGGTTAVAGRLVALLAQPGRARLQQVVV